MSAEADALIAAARAAARHAYAPYSRFAVGAAVLLVDGSVVIAANVENASYGLSLCAETVAVAKVASEGRLRDMVAIGVVGGAMRADGAPVGDTVVRPCGRCRQVLNEAAHLSGRDLIIYAAGAEGTAVETWRISQLLPAAFGPSNLA